MYVSVRPTWRIVEPSNAARTRDVATQGASSHARDSEALFPRRMQDTRVQACVTFAQLAALLVDVTPPQLAKWERGDDVPSAEMRARIEAVLASELRKRKEQQQQQPPTPPPPPPPAADPALPTTRKRTRSPA